MIALLALMHGALAACPVATTADDVVRHLLDAEDAYKSLEVDAFTHAVDEASLDVACLGTVIEPDLAAWVHRMMGLKLLAVDENRSMLALAAARHLDPDFTFPAELVPDGHPARARYEQADPSSATTPIGPPLHGYSLHFDGAGLRKGRPSARASIAQVENSTGEIDGTAYVFPTDPLPRYPAGPVPEGSSGGGDPRVGIAIGTAALAVGGGVLWAASGAQKKRFTSTPLAGTPAENEAELQGYAAQANTLGAAAAGATALAAAGGVTLLVAF